MGIRMYSRFRKRSHAYIPMKNDKLSYSCWKYRLFIPHVLPILFCHWGYNKKILCLNVVESRILITFKLNHFNQIKFTGLIFWMFFAVQYCSKQNKKNRVNLLNSYFVSLSKHIYVSADPLSQEYKLFQQSQGIFF